MQEELVASQKDTLGIVNDQKGSTYKRNDRSHHMEKPFYSRRKRCSSATGKRNENHASQPNKEFFWEELPHFASGIGEFFGGVWDTVKDFTGNVWDYITASK
ncbi:hypothetical protein [Mediterraneibacter gnavus]|uniref:hypothetical protein n=1 Tax=Mediterraneibacter gnavus TaxID=33038 RepID=UPI000A7607FB|nr:hypothetical protein [Mediterraneibacter gnavus]